MKNNFENGNFAITGISGVGKNFTLEKLRDEEILDFYEIHAGTFIKDCFKKYRDKSREENIDAAFAEIEDNIRARNFGQVALNCHTIYSDGGEIFSNLKRISQTSISKIITIERTPEIIAKQRLQDLSRNRSLETIDQIHNLQKLSTNVAREISKNKNIPLKIFNPDIEEVENLVDFIEN